MNSAVSANPIAEDEQRLSVLFEKLFGRLPERIDVLRAHASARRLYRLHGETRTVIGVANADRAENRAFVQFSLHFKRCDLPVPHIYGYDEEREIYLQEDLGNETLFDRLSSLRTAADPFPVAVEDLYRKALAALPKFQVCAAKTLDFGFCHQDPSFGRASMLKDMRFFRERFARVSGLAFDNDALEREFETLADCLAGAPADYFLYRDFQSRNIMVRSGDTFKDAPFFIDYQAGRKGALQYDVASLLYQSQAQIPAAARERLLDYYISELAAHTPVDRDSFIAMYYGFVYLRTMQVLGTYGLRGLIEGKPYFIESIAFARKNLQELLSSHPLPVELPELSRLFRVIAEQPSPLHVMIRSFSYRGGYPAEEATHGGGFVFDCRCVPNPGRQPEFMKKTGLDEDVRAFLEADTDARAFWSETSQLVGHAVARYRDRGFTALSVSFGCTGGRHRSVFFAEKLAAQLRALGGVAVSIVHREQTGW